MRKFMFLCDKCKRIAYKKIIDPDPNFIRYCTKCNNPTHIVNNDELSNLDDKLLAHNIKLVWFDPGCCKFGDTKFSINYPIMKYIDNRYSDFTNALRSIIDKRYEIYVENDKGLYTEFGIKYVGPTIELDPNTGTIDIAADIMSIRKHFHDTISRATESLKTQRSRPIGKKYMGDQIIRDTRKAYWCNECGNIGYISITSRPILGTEIEFDSSIEVTDPIVSHHVWCTKCKSYMIELDCDIAERIKALNNIGINTKYCCQGHYRKMHRYEFPKVPVRPSFYYTERPYINFIVENDRIEDTLFIIRNVIEKLEKSGEYNDIIVEESAENEGIVCTISVDIPEINEDVLNSMCKLFMQFVDEFIEEYKARSN